MRAILTYHSIDRSGSPISVHPDVFESHVRWLASGRVRAVSLDDLLASQTEDDAVAVTFDDGFTNFATEAVPRLAEHGVTATLFVVTDHVGRTNEWRGHGDPGVPTLPLLDWADLGHLAGLGISIGAHTRTHAALGRLTPGEIDDEVEGSAERLRSELGIVPRSFAYPYGSVSDVAVRVVRRFAWACTTEFRALDAHEDAALLPRLDMYYFGAGWPLTSWGTPTFRAYVGARRLLRHGRRLMHREPRAEPALAAGSRV
jgi:peptidoglycan/xylan/chitin deacetylase (PgdA/CDA1 family)